MNKEKAFFGINLIFALFFLIYALIKKSVYIYDGALYIVLTLLLWKFGRKLGQNYISMTLIFIAALYHNLGTFGLFAYSPLGLPYDKILHFWAGIYLTTALFLFGKSRKLDTKSAIFLAIIGSLGIGAFGELNEFAGWQLFPPRTSFEGGLLDPGVGKFLQEKDYLGYVYLDTIKDMALNLTGSLLTAFVLGVRFKKAKPKK